MLVDHSLEELKERCDKLLSKKMASGLSDAHRRCITNKFAGKSLQELYDLVQQLRQDPSD